MKTLCFFTVSILLVNFGCSNNSGPGANGNTTSNTGISTGADYLPLVANALWTGHVTGSEEFLDQDGNVYRSDETDADYKTNLGALQTRNGRSMHSVFAFDKNGVIANDGAALGYEGLSNGEIIAWNRFNNGANDSALILPQTLSIGLTWNPAPEVPTVRCQATLVQHFSQYSNKGGISYNDVIQVHVSYIDSSSYYDTISYLDSSSYTTFYDTIVNRSSVNGDLYFANGIGIVEADIPSYDSYERTYYKEHKIGSVTVYRKD